MAEFGVRSIKLGDFLSMFRCGHRCRKGRGSGLTSHPSETKAGEENGEQGSHSGVSVVAEPGISAW